MEYGARVTWAYTYDRNAAGEGLSQHWNQTWHVPRSSCESESPSDMTADISDLGSFKKTHHTTCGVMLGTGVRCVVWSF